MTAFVCISIQSVNISLAQNPTLQVGDQLQCYYDTRDCELEQWLEPIAMWWLYVCDGLLAIPLVIALVAGLFLAEQAMSNRFYQIKLGR